MCRRVEPEDRAVDAVALVDRPVHHVGRRVADAEVPPPCQVVAQLVVRRRHVARHARHHPPERAYLLVDRIGVADALLGLELRERRPRAVRPQVPQPRPDDADYELRGLLRVLRAPASCSHARSRHVVSHPTMVGRDSQKWHGFGLNGPADSPERASPAVLNWPVGAALNGHGPDRSVPPSIHGALRCRCRRLCAVHGPLLSALVRAVRRHRADRCRPVGTGARRGLRPRDPDLRAGEAPGRAQRERRRPGRGVRAGDRASYPAVDARRPPPRTCRSPTTPSVRRSPSSSCTS